MGAKQNHVMVVNATKRKTNDSAHARDVESQDIAALIARKKVGNITNHCANSGARVGRRSNKLSVSRSRDEDQNHVTTCFNSTNKQTKDSRLKFTSQCHQDS
jgi:hypothetical protein